MPDKSSAHMPHEELLSALLSGTGVNHACDNPQLLETHISWVVLLGKYAYKIKKPVNLGFVDYSSLAKRQYFCAEEVRMNRRTAPDLYLAVVAFSGTHSDFQLTETGPEIEIREETFEYAVKMRRFDQAQILSHLASDGLLNAQMAERLAHSIAEFHLSLAPLRLDETDMLANILQEALDNFSVLQKSPKNLPEAMPQAVPKGMPKGMPEDMSEQEQRGQLDQLRQWTVARHQQLSNTFLARVRQGHIKLCHGDLHLGNIYYGDGRCILFDCIEFNPELSQIDTASDLAFAHMDLALKTSMGHADLMLNEYLAITGDYELLKVLDYYCAYRSMVRAKVHSLAARQATQTSQQTQAKILSQVSLAAKYTQPKPQAIVLMCGLSGSGKTHVADQIKAATGFIHLRSDVERKRLFGLALNADSHENGLQIYTHAATQQTYEVLAKQVQTVVEAGYGVIVDATFIHAAWRQTFLNAARQLGISACIVHCLVTPAEARRRLAARHEDASEADYSIYKQQSARFEAVAEGEAEQLISIDTQTADYLPPLLASISDVCRLTTWH